MILSHAELPVEDIGSLLHVRRGDDLGGTVADIEDLLGMGDRDAACLLVFVGRQVRGVQALLDTTQTPRIAQTHEGHPHLSVGIVVDLALRAVGLAEHPSSIVVELGFPVAILCEGVGIGAEDGDVSVDVLPRLDLRPGVRDADEGHEGASAREAAAVVIVIEDVLQIVGGIGRVIVGDGGLEVVHPCDRDLAGVHHGLIPCVDGVTLSVEGAANETRFAGILSHDCLIQRFDAGWLPGHSGVIVCASDEGRLSGFVNRQQAYPR